MEKEANKNNGRKLWCFGSYWGGWTAEKFPIQPDERESPKTIAKLSLRNTGGAFNFPTFPVAGEIFKRLLLCSPVRKHYQAEDEHFFHFNSLWEGKRILAKWWWQFFSAQLSVRLHFQLKHFAAISSKIMFCGRLNNNYSLPLDSKADTSHVECRSGYLIKRKKDIFWDGNESLLLWQSYAMRMEAKRCQKRSKRCQGFADMDWERKLSW